MAIGPPAEIVPLLLSRLRVPRLRMAVKALEEIVPVFLSVSIVLLSRA
jgi:hypothetical protein